MPPCCHALNTARAAALRLCSAALHRQNRLDKQPACVYPRRDMPNMPGWWNW